MLYLNLRNRCQTVIRALSVLTKILFIYLSLFFTLLSLVWSYLISQGYVWHCVECEFQFVQPVLVYLHPPDFFFSNCGPLFHACPCEVLSQVVNVQRVYWEFKSVLHITSKVAELLQISIVWPLWGNGLLQAIEILSIVFTAYSSDGHVTLFASDPFPN